MMIILLILLILGVMFGISGGVASSRGHSFLLFGFLGIFTSPVVAIIVAFIIPAKNTYKTTRRKIVRSAVRGNNSKGSKNPYESPQETSGYSRRGNISKGTGRSYRR